MTTKSIPYSSSVSGKRARAEIVGILKGLGCESVAIMDDFADHSLLLAFTHRGKRVQLRASARGWAAMYLKANPWSGYRRATRQQWEAAALEQGLIAVESILRDWIKGQVTAIETGILSFEAVFAGHMLLPNGETMLQRIEQIVAAMPALEDHHASP